VIGDASPVERSVDLDVEAQRMLDRLAPEVLVGVARIGDGVPDAERVERPAGVDVGLAEIGLAIGILCWARPAGASKPTSPTTSAAIVTGRRSRRIGTLLLVVGAIAPEAVRLNPSSVAVRPNTVAARRSLLVMVVLLIVRTLYQLVAVKISRPGHDAVGDALLRQLVLLHPVSQPVPRDPPAARRPRDVPAGGAKRAEQSLALQRGQAPEQHVGALRRGLVRRRRRARKPEHLLRDLRLLGQKRRPFDDVAELPDVAWPAVLEERLTGAGCQRLRRKPVVE
jgi:hypothetical protein